MAIKSTVDQGQAMLTGGDDVLVIDLQTVQALRDEGRGG